MNQQQLKELYATGDYVCYTHDKESTRWYESKKPAFGTNNRTYKLIHHKHSYIAKKVAENPDEQVHHYIRKGVYQCVTAKTFFDNYNDKDEFRLAFPDGSLDNKRIHVENPEYAPKIQALVRERGYEVMKSDLDMVGGFVYLIHYAENLYTYATDKIKRFDQLTPIHYDPINNQLVDKPIKWGIRPETVLYDDIMADGTPTKSLDSNMKEDLITQDEVSVISEIIDNMEGLMNEDTCKWDYENDVTSCGSYICWELMMVVKSDDEAKFCPYCGKPLESLKD